MALAGGLQANPALESFRLALHAGEGFAVIEKRMLNAALVKVIVSVPSFLWKCEKRSNN